MDRMERMEQVERLRQIAAQLRVDSLRCSTAAGSGHPTSSLSAADLMAVLLEGHLRWDLRHPNRANADHLIFSKGHASPLLYAMLKAVGVISDAELLTFRRLGSRLQGHPAPTFPQIDVATGSLGQGLPVGVGIALSARYLEKSQAHVWVLLGDSEMSEGSIWEAFDHARYYKLGNLIAILDMNRLGQRGETPLGWNASAYAARARAFGWRAFAIDGHDVSAIGAAYNEALRDSDTPTLIIAGTLKGKGVALVENKNGWHGKVLDEAQCAKAVAELGGQRNLQVVPRPPPRDVHAAAPIPQTATPLTLPAYDRSKPVATRKAYGDALLALGNARTDIVALDAEVGNSTFAEEFAKAHPERYFEMFIAEQQMVAAAVGLSARGWVTFASTFAAFMTRTYDFIRMGAVSGANLRLCGSHAGVSIGEDGPSQMGLEDIAIMRAVHGSTVLYPCCANQTAQLVASMVDRKGIVYLRATRAKTPILYETSESFPIGGAKILRESTHDTVTIIAAGITVHEALKAYDMLREKGVSARVVDAYSIKPIDSARIRSAVEASAGNVVIVEDHWPEGGLGDAVRECLGSSRESPILARIAHLAVRRMPSSGTPAELLRVMEIDARAIADAATELLASVAPECFVCGCAAAWKIEIAGEDEPRSEEHACELHAHGHIRVAQVARPS
jgi:transketolase